MVVRQAHTEASRARESAPFFWVAGRRPVLRRRRGSFSLHDAHRGRFQEYGGAGSLRFVEQVGGHTPIPFHAAFEVFCFAMRPESNFLAFSSSRRREAVRFFPPRFMKYVSMRIPEPGPLGETLREARVFAMVAASFVNRPGDGCVESVVTCAIQRLLAFFLFVERRVAISTLPLMSSKVSPFDVGTGLTDAQGQGKTGPGFDPEEMTRC